MKKFLFGGSLVLICFIAKAQDSIRISQLDSVIIVNAQKQAQLKPLPDVKGTYIFAGKKTETINLDKLDVNRTDNNARQIFAKVPGVYVYENDGTGNQVNIATRGLTAHRSWELNVRHNGVMTNSDLYGYPASHFNAPTESIERIELVRGSGALQYGAQFGGMLNYVTKQADTTKRYSFETKNAVGSYGLFSTYNAAGGKVNKLTYYTYLNFRKSDGYRESSDYKYFAGHAHIIYDISSRLKLRAEYNYMNYRNHVNGGLTDAQFYDDPRQSTRKRNYYSPIIHVPSIQLDYKISENTSLNFASSAILGSRNSVQFIALSTVKDTFNTALGSFNPRQVDIDTYNSYANEIRVLHQYHLLGRKHAVTSGIRYINNDLHRQQLGRGTTGWDYDLTLTDPRWGRDLHFKTRNVSVFAENLLRITTKLSSTMGIRYENGGTKMRGTINNYPLDEIPLNIDHKFALLGAGLQYAAKENLSFYANWAQAYRPVIFADVIPTTILNKVDPQIKDATGYNAEFGFRGSVKNYLSLDLTVYHMRYNNRNGNIALTDAQGQTYFYRTNTGNTATNGAELYVEVNPIKWLTTYKTSFQVSLFNSTSYINAKYRKGSVVASNLNRDVKGNRVEVTPQWISRSGVQVKYKTFSGSVQYSYTDWTFNDALNTVAPNASGTIGRVPGYQLVDLNLTYRFLKHFTSKLAFNNIFNKQYFTQRPLFFPGPGGIYPSDGRSMVLSIEFKL